MRIQACQHTTIVLDQTLPVFLTFEDLDDVKEYELRIASAPVHVAFKAAISSCVVNACTNMTNCSPDQRIRSKNIPNTRIRDISHVNKVNSCLAPCHTLDLNWLVSHNGSRQVVAGKHRGLYKVPLQLLHIVFVLTRTCKKNITTHG